MEVILAFAISALVLVVVCGVFNGALRLRAKTSDAVENAMPLSEAMDLLRRDLLGALGPSNILAGDFKCGSATMGAEMGLSSSEGLGLDFFTSTGQINDDEPWGDIQEVYYQLANSTDRNSRGKDLIRYVNRNLLATAQPTPDRQWLAGNIANVQFECYDGLQWRNLWDTSMGDTNLPAAVRVRIQPAQEINATAAVQPFEMIVPLVAHSRTNHVQ